MNSPDDLFTPSTVFQPVPAWAVLPAGAIRDFDYVRGLPLARWNPPPPGPEAVVDKRTGLPQVVPSQEELASAGKDGMSESKPEPVNPSYVKAVTPEEEAEYGAWTASEKQGETPEEYTKRRTLENKAAIFSEMEAKDQQQNEWLTVLPAAVLAGDELSKIKLPPRQVIIADWFSEGDCGFIFAPRGLGKTWMNLGLAVAITTKGAFGPYSSQVAWPVLYVDGEMPFEVMRSRILALHGAIPENFHFLSHEMLFQQEQKTLNLLNTASQEAVTALCLAKHIRVLILDNLSCLFGGLKENDADSWEPVKLWLLTLRRHRIAVIVVHHTGRNPQYMRGTTRREDDVFWVIRLEEPADAKVTRTPGARFITRFTKNRGAPTEPLSYDWLIQPEGDRRVQVSYKESNSDDVIVAWVRDGLTTATDIAMEMGVTKGTISRRVARLIEQGRLEKHQRHYVLGPIEQPNWHEERDWKKT
jgi:putative DNA primase/helicase